MIKRLKTLEQIKSEYNGFKDRYGGLEFKNENGMFDGRITKSMFKYFGAKIDVKTHERSGNVKYAWKISKYGSSVNHWVFKDDWFMNVELLEDSLFEI